MKNETGPQFDEKPHAFLKNEIGRELPDFFQKSTPPVTISHTTIDEKSEQTFDPYDFGKENGIGCFGACVHIVRATIGSGILMMPYAMKNLGLLNGTILIFFAGLLYYHNIHILVSTEYYLCKLLKVKHLSYVGVIRNSFHTAPYPINKLKMAVSHLAHLYLSLPAGPPTYLIIMATNIRLMADYFDVHLNEKIIITTIIIPIIIFTQKRNILKILVPFSSITNMFTVLMILVILSYSFIYRKVDSSPKITGDLLFIPKAFAIFILSVSSIKLTLPLKSTMENPKRFSDTCGSINIAGLCIILIYYSFAAISYINYGDVVQENILSSLPPKNCISFTIYLLYTLSLSIVYILTFFSGFDNLWSNELESQMKDGLRKTICERAVSLGLNLLTYFFAVAVPRISLIAAICGTFGFLIELALPPSIETLLQIREKKIRCTTILKDLIIIIISFALFSMSAVRCIREVIQLYAE